MNTHCVRRGRRIRPPSGMRSPPLRDRLPPVIGKRGSLGGAPRCLVVQGAGFLMDPMSRPSTVAQLAGPPIIFLTRGADAGRRGGSNRNRPLRGRRGRWMRTGGRDGSAVLILLRQGGGRTARVRLRRLDDGGPDTPLLRFVTLCRRRRRARRAHGCPSNRRRASGARGRWMMSLGAPASLRASALIASYTVRSSSRATLRV